MKRNQSGFTLIEIAIVLVIIGLLLGGVLKGQELINSAKVKNLATDFRNIPVYVYGYQDKFRALPGDDNQAISHVSAATNGDGSGLIDGPWDSLKAANETQKFWADVRLAGLAAGPTTGPDLLPTNAVGGVIGITSSNTANFSDPSAGTPTNPKISGSYIICSSGILGKYAKQLDLQMDDGSPIGGSMREFTDTTPGTRPSTLIVPTALTNGMINDNDTFTVCMGV